ncbi:hypothetical protein ADICEAN_03906 [Cesiribacter andamanensis AMV16]|uniref:Uncharacterized protein n=2 Tax=Cesiribacter TaxID=1133570 RepID=M7MX23_9BACT|nr:hypothetical protein ADICEAN_03906 [Cesiribacter andamanensis AMV16]
MNEESLYNNLNLLNLMDYFKMWMTLGIILMSGLLLVYMLSIRSLQGSLRRLEGEHTATKARMYDMEESRKAEDEQAGRRIEAFRSSLEKGGRTDSSTPPPADGPTPSPRP